MLTASISLCVWICVPYMGKSLLKKFAQIKFREIKHAAAELLQIYRTLKCYGREIQIQRVHKLKTIIHFAEASDC